ncbi:MAG: hypothetical protein HOH43_21395 [Candidatus Latescibacteria bacterium]|nr:hypothetical protein [Candidatus Latescibacterota bacterium]
MKADFHLDERSRGIIHGVCTIMYLITLVMIMVAMFYRQFVLLQPTGVFEDLAVILTINAAVLLSAVLYFGGLSFEKIKPVRLITLYVGFVALGFAFTLVKYFVLLDQPLSSAAMLSKLGIIAAILAILTGLNVLFAYLGKRKTERQMM